MSEPRPRRRWWRSLMALVGLGLLAGVIAQYGWQDVGRAFLGAGWGIVWVSLFHFVPVACDTLGWRQLFRPEGRVGLPRMFVFRWIGESVNNLLPVAQVGGDMLRARLAARFGATFRGSAAATLVDFTIGLVTQMGVGLVALGLLAWQVGFSGALGWILLGIAVFGALIGGFVAAQAGGLFHRAGRFAASLRAYFNPRSPSRLSEGTAEVDGSIRETYGRRAALGRCVAWRVGGWTVGTVEIWLATYFLGEPVGLADAFIVHALTTAIRSIAFMVPAGLGVQEGGFVLVGGLLGLSGPTALALGLVRRAREVLLGAPGLLLWWFLETHRAAAKEGV